MTGHLKDAEQNPLLTTHVSLDGKSGPEPRDATGMTTGHGAVTLCNVAEVIMGQSPDGRLYNQANGGKPLITGAGQLGILFPRPTQYSLSGSKCSQRGDIIICIRATIGQVNWSDRDYYLGRGVAVIRPSSQIVPGFLWHVLKYKRSELEGKGNGSTFKQVKREDLEGLSIPLPPIPEQERIANILDKADSIRKKRQESIARLDTLVKSVFLEMFGSEAGGPIVRVPLYSVAVVVSGVTKGRNLTGKTTVQLPYLRVANVQDGFLNLDEIRMIQALPSDLLSCRLEPGDVLMTEGGDFDKLGRGALWEGRIADCIHQNHVFRVRLDTSQVLPEYFVSFLKTWEAKRYFLQCAKRTTNLASINMSQLRALPVPVFPIGLQERFVRAYRCAKTTGERLLFSASRLDAMYDSLQHRAFCRDFEGQSMPRCQTSLS